MSSDGVGYGRVWSEKVYRERTIEKEINKRTIHHVVIEDLQTHALRRKGDNRYNMSGTYNTLALLLPFLKNHYFYVFLAWRIKERYSHMNDFQDLPRAFLYADSTVYSTGTND